MGLGKESPCSKGLWFDWHQKGEYPSFLSACPSVRPKGKRRRWGSKLSIVNISKYEVIFFIRTEKIVLDFICPVKNPWSNQHLVWSLVFKNNYYYCWDFPGGSDDKEPTYNAGDPGLIPGLGRSTGVGNGNPFQYSCLENSMDRGAWWITVDRITNSWTWLSN